ncbi:GNAT family N-acetyltransferase [Bdellovibrio sp. NC01]|uniref:GNAT family N-acetyltransferase n=1 Tax=Bdellovibrio sp. NC01 TaxID=2220073 RepID=UPI001158B8AD|nr:GNAT family N-acetyltransferase [Bdellovibrio sp. NC01]QDK37738.1 N-acetyltransferase [Bdellovibrio sp. NC01]
MSLQLISIEQKAFPTKLDGNNIYLERHSQAIANDMFNTIEANRERLRQFLPWVDNTKELDNSRAWINLALAEWDSLAMFDYGIYLKDTKKYVGNIGVHNINWEVQKCELGYWLSSEAEGRGIMSEAVRIIEAYCFNAKFHRVEIRCSSNNIRSAEVAKRCGYVFEGELREDAREMGKYRNTKIFGKLSQEFFKK